MREVREGVVTTHEKKVKEDYQKGPMGSSGYGGKFGVQKDRMDKVANLIYLVICNVITTLS